MTAEHPTHLTPTPITGGAVAGDPVAGGPQQSAGSSGHAAGSSGHSVHLSKQLLRQATLVRRRQLGGTERARANSARSVRLLGLIGADQRVASYLSRADEPDTLEVVSALVGSGRPVLAPVVAAESAPSWTLLTSMSDLGPGPFGIPQPTGQPLPGDALAHADLIVVSGLAGTRDGARLGVGGGWFDRALAHARADAEVVLLLHHCEVVAELPLERHDRRVRRIVTERELITCW